MSDFYHDQSVIVLGGAGFVGQHLCRLLVERGANVYIVDDLSRSAQSRGRLTIQAGRTGIDRNSIFVANSASGWVKTMLERIKPFAVFNLAARVAGVEYNQTHQAEMFSRNASLQVDTVTLCDRLAIPHFLQVSSACVYGEDANNPAFESNLGGEPTPANSGYAWAKRMGERAIKWSNLPHAVTVRPSNIYGPGDWYDDRAHVIPKLIKSQLEGTAKFFASQAVREFLYVEDAARGMMAALEFGKNKTVYNLGTGGMTKISMGDLHKEIARLTGTALPPETEPPFDTGDTERWSDCFRINQFWQHEVNIYDGLRYTVDDYMSTIKD